MALNFKTDNITKDEGGEKVSRKAAKAKGLKTLAMCCARKVEKK